MLEKVSHCCTSTLYHVGKLTVKCTAVVVGVIACDIANDCGQIFHDKFNQIFPSPSDLFPSSLRDAISYVNQPILEIKALSRQATSWIIPNQRACRIVAHATVEEAIFRLGIQKLLLPKIAEYLPAHLASSLKNRFTRVILTSLIFSAAHFQLENFWNNSTPGIYAFTFGLGLGTAQELLGPKSGFVAASVMHIFVNAQQTMKAATPGSGLFCPIPQNGKYIHLP